jgi:hypothetical protein
MSAFVISKEIYWVECRHAWLDRNTGDMIGEHLFFSPRVETVIDNLCRICEQVLNMISQPTIGSMASSFRFFGVAVAAYGA